jgi:ABC-2 type transport system permease protein
MTNVYTAFLKLSFLKMLAYRMRYYTGILTYTLYVSVQYFIWKAVYSGGAAESLHGYTLPQMITYVTVGWMARSFYYSNIDDEVESLVSSGQIGTFLLRPVDFQGLLFSQAIGESIFRILCFCFPISLCIVFLFPVAPPSSWEAGILFGISSLLGFFILGCINFITGLFSFFFYSIRGIMRAKYFIVQLCSGLLLPLQFFPHDMATLLRILPFHGIAYTPLQFYLGKVSGSAALLLIAEQIGWIIGLFLVGRLFWSRAKGKLLIQGG